MTFNRDFVLLWQGQLVSQLGNQAFLIAMAYRTLEDTQSTTLVGAVMMASTVPLALLGPFGGAIADRHSRRTILVVTDLLRAIAVGALGVFLLWRPEVSASHVVAFIAIAAFNGTMAALFTPALHAIIPDLVRSDRLASANAVSQFSTQATILVGQAAGGVLYVSWGAAALLLLDALSFGYAGLATWFISGGRETPARNQRPRLAIRQHAIEALAGVVYVRRRRGMLSLLVVFTGINFLFMPVFVLLPLYVGSVLGAGPDWYGFLLAGSGAGALGGTALTGLLPRVGRSAHLLTVCAAGIGGCVLALAATSAPLVALGMFVAIGMLSAVINVTAITSFQAVPSELRGRVMALVVAMSTAAVPIGMGLGGVAGDLWPGALTSVFAACGGAILVLIAVGARVPGFADVLEAQAPAT